MHTIAKRIITNPLTHVSALRNESYVFETLNLSHANQAIELLAE